MKNGFLIGSPPSKGLYQNFTNFDQVKNSFSNLSFGNFAPFYDPFDPFLASSSSSSAYQCANSFPISEPENPFGSNGEKIGFLSYPLRILLQDVSNGPNFQEFKQMHLKPPGRVSCLTVDGKHQGKANLKKKKKKMMMTKKKKKKKKKKEQPKESKKGYQNSPFLVKGQWTLEEDRSLVELVKHYGERRWSQIAEMLNERVGKQCRERWHNHLRLDIKKDTWIEEEEMMLIEAHMELGNKWAAIARKMLGRTENTVKNHWNATKRRRFATTKHHNNLGNYDNSLLRNYIMSLTSPDETQKDQTATKRSDDGSDHHHNSVDLGQNGFGSQVFDEMLEMGF